jgi:hypothetical protein
MIEAAVERFRPLFSFYKYYYSASKLKYKTQYIKLLPFLADTQQL